MHDLFVLSNNLHKRVRDCKVVEDGIESDHSAVQIKLALTSIKFKEQDVSRGIIDWCKILNDDRI